MPPRSIANSSALMAHHTAIAQWNRPGIMLYGSSPFEMPHTIADTLQPVMILTSAIIAIREIPVGEGVGYGATWRADRPSRIATIAIGYGDGYPRGARSGTAVLVNGARAPRVGRVSMDMITVDVTELPSADIGDEVILWGPDLSINEIATCAGTIGYELLASMPNRTIREYLTS